MDTIQQNIKKRRLLFLLGCIPSRLFLAYVAYKAITTKHKWSSVFGVFMIAIGLGFWTIYLTNSRQTGPEVFGDKIWWNSLRPIHGTLWLIAGILFLQKNPLCVWIMLLDTLIGLFSFLHHHQILH